MPVKKSSVIKRSSSGMELELQLLDDNGRVATRASEFIKKVKSENKSVSIVNESLEHMFELKSLPKVKLRDSLPRLFDELEVVLSTADKMDLNIFGLGSFPGDFEQKLTQKKRYNLVASVFKSKKIFALGYFGGFHYHYAMPRGVFDHKKGFLKQLFSSKTKQSLIDSYNLLIASDPATSTLMQSSPFLRKKFVGKDSRMLFLRSPADTGYADSFFSDLPKFGELPDYLFTMQDLRYRLMRLDKRFKKLLEKSRFENEAKRKKLLDFVWTVVKVNKLGTLEQRGCDMNHPKYFAGIAVLFKAIQRVVQQEFYGVEVSDVAIKEPFKVEGEKILIPPQSYVRLVLQPASALKGFEDPQVYNYVKRFFNFGKKNTPQSYRKLLYSLSGMIERKKTVSDIMISRVKKKGYSPEDAVPQEVCSELALKHAEQFRTGALKTMGLIPQ
jgi:hypothetical protein